MSPSFRSSLRCSSEVRQAIEDHAPIVALESTILCHGMPYPQNVATAMEMQATIRRAGAVPAMCAVLDGQPTVGLDDDTVELLGRDGDRITKASRRDLPILAITEKHGATTVAATMIIAAMAGIRVFATGGIGGVHRGVEDTLDISADLEELARTNVAVVCGGHQVRAGCTAYA